jgi:hypothetical protein
MRKSESRKTQFVLPTIAAAQNQALSRRSSRL